MQNKEYFLNKGNKERERSNFQKALFFYQNALNLGASFEAELGIAHTLRMMGDFEGALKFYSKVSKRYKKKQILADSFLGKALSLKGLSRTQEAIKFLKKAEKIYENLDDETGIAYLYWAYCVVLRVQGDFKDALDFGEKALGMYNHFKDKRGILYSSCALGGLNRILGNLEDSFEYYKKANEIAKSLKDRFGTAYSYCGLGNYYRMKFKFKKAMENFKKAEEIYGEIGDIVSFSYTLWSKGILKTLQKDLNEANSYFQRAYSNFEKTKDKRGVIYSLMGLIQLNFLEGKSIIEKKKKCMGILKKYKLPWEELLFKILISKIDGKKKSFEKELSFFCTSYKFEKFPLNFP